MSSSLVSVTSVFVCRWRAAVASAAQWLVLALLAGACSTAHAQGSIKVTQELDQPYLRSKIALVIGNSKYKSMTPLENAANDLAAMCSKVQSLGFSATCIGDVPGRRQLNDLAAKVRRQLKDAGGGTLMIYYAGHGLEYAGRNFIIPTEAKISDVDDLQAESVDIQTFISKIVGDGADRITNFFSIIILDSCRDNSLSLIGAKATDAVPEPWPQTLGYYKLFATSSGRVASDGIGSNGLFTKHLLRLIGQPDIDVGEVGRRVAAEVVRESQAMNVEIQIPVREISFNGTYCFVSCVDPVHEAAKAREKLERALGEKQKAQEEAAAVAAQVARLKAELQDARRFNNTALSNDKEAELARQQAELLQRQQAMAEQQMALTVQQRQYEGAMQQVAALQKQRDAERLAAEESRRLAAEAEQRASRAEEEAQQAKTEAKRKKLKSGFVAPAL